MSLEKAIIHKKEHRKQYRGSKAFDCSCRNHGSCGYCESNRTIFDKKTRLRVSDQVDEWFGYWNYPDPSDATDAAYDEGLKQIDVDPWDFETRRELDV
jgi:hypothetical protein